MFKERDYWKGGKHICYRNFAFQGFYLSPHGGLNLNLFIYCTVRNLTLLKALRGLNPFSKSDQIVICLV